MGSVCYYLREPQEDNHGTPLVFVHGVGMGLVRTVCFASSRALLSVCGSHPALDHCAGKPCTSHVADDQAAHICFTLAYDIYCTHHFLDLKENARTIAQVLLASLKLRLRRITRSLNWSRKRFMILGTQVVLGRPGKIQSWLQAVALTCTFWPSATPLMSCLLRSGHVPVLFIEAHQGQVGPAHLDAGAAPCVDEARPGGAQHGQYRELCLSGLR